uniref:Uncharacterized protein n=1 Tax=Arundo donax TaxID=35708 RepID=A0A0A9HCE9_ARUDO
MKLIYSIYYTFVSIHFILQLIFVNSLSCISVTFFLEPSIFYPFLVTSPIIVLFWLYILRLSSE